MKQIKLRLETNNTKPFEETLEESVQSIIIRGIKEFEIHNNNNILDLCFSRWEVFIVPLTPNLDELGNFIIKICSNLNIDVLSYEVIEDDTNYLNQETQRYSIDMSNFVIFNNEEDFLKFYSPTKIPLLIKQSTGFGTGKHETTSMCLEIISDLYKKGYYFNNMLDLGTGSAILAVVMQKLFKGNILATDIDNLAIFAANESISKNNSNDRIKTLISNGFDKIQTQEFDLITANILLNPLIDMVNDFYRYLSYGGHLVLSGFLITQADKIVRIFKDKGFFLVKIKEKSNWQSIIFTK